MYQKPLIPRIVDETLFLLYKGRIVKLEPLSDNADTIIVGKPIFEYNPIYSTQYSTTQGIPALNIFNHYDVPIHVNDRILQPRCQLRYKGTYDNGIPYGKIFSSSFDEDVILTEPATNLHYGHLINSSI